MGNNGNGLFLNYIIDEELNDPDLPIEKELGDDCDPNDCVYSWMNNETEFPIPHYAVIPAQKKEAFIFYVLQYCYKTQQPPSDQYIQQTLIPKCGGSINHNLLQLSTNQNDDNNTIQSPSTQPSTAPIPFCQTSAISAIPDKNGYSKQSSMNEDAQGVPQCLGNTEDDDVKEVIRLTKKEFKPKYPARAHLNIFTAKESTKELREVMEEEFENDLILYYYSDISTALQINDHQMTEFTMLMDGKKWRLSVIIMIYIVKEQMNIYMVSLYQMIIIRSSKINGY